MFRNQALVDSALQSFYGYGVFLEKTDLGSLVSHSGGWPGYTTFLARNIDHDQTLIVLSNNASHAPAIAEAIHHILHDKPVIMPYRHREIALDSLALQAFAGTYKSTRELHIACIEGKLYRTLPNGRKMELRLESATRFFYADGSDRQIEFVRDADRRITAAILIQYDVKTEYEK